MDLIWPFENTYVHSNIPTEYLLHYILMSNKVINVKKNLKLKRSDPWTQHWMLQFLGGHFMIRFTSMTSNCVKQIEIPHSVWQRWRVQMQGALWGDRHLAQSYVHLLFGECTACGKSDSFYVFSLAPGTGNMRPDGSSSSSSLGFRGVKRLQMSVWPSWVLHSQTLHRVVVVLPPWPPCCYSYTPGQLVRFIFFSLYCIGEDLSVCISRGDV